VIHHLRECVSAAPKSNGSKLYPTPVGIAHGDLRCAAARPLKPISRSSLRTVIVLTLLPGQMRCALQHQLSHSVSLCGLSLRGCAIVAPRHFQFTKTALTVEL
jgi:hypothetical protein